MAFKKFNENDLIYNRLKMHPKVQFDVHSPLTSTSGSIYYQNENALTGAFTDNVPNIPTGHVSLYELNVDRNETQTGLIYPFITKDGTLSSFGTVTTSEFNQDFNYGDMITGSYPLSASITREHTGASLPRRHVDALRNTLDYNKKLSKHYAYSSSLGDKGTQEINVIYIPSLFYGSTIKKGSISLDFFCSGSLAGRLTDSKRNGELIQLSGAADTNDGDVAGVCLYDQGVILLTGSWELTDSKGWLDFAEGANDGSTPDDEISSRIVFNGTTYANTITMLAHAERGEINYSSNPTFIDYGDKALEPATSSLFYSEKEKTIKNTVKTPYADPTGSFEKTTYISKVGIYDENRNLIGIASLATPVKKTEERDFTFKLKLDI